MVNLRINWAENILSETINQISIFVIGITQTDNFNKQWMSNCTNNIWL